MKGTSGRNFQNPYFFDFRLAFFADRTLDFFAIFLDFLAADFVAAFFVVFVAALFADAFFADFFSDFSAVFLRDLPVFRAIERVAAFGLDLGLVMSDEAISLNPISNDRKQQVALGRLYVRFRSCCP